MFWTSKALIHHVFEPLLKAFGEDLEEQEPGLSTAMLQKLLRWLSVPISMQGKQSLDERLCDLEAKSINIASRTSSGSEFWGVLGLLRPSCGSVRPRHGAVHREERVELRWGLFQRLFRRPKWLAEVGFLQIMRWMLDTNFCGINSIAQKAPRELSWARFRVLECCRDGSQHRRPRRHNRNTSKRRCRVARAAYYS